MLIRNQLGILLLLLIMASCSGEKEDRYIFETERILDTETGDAYYVKNPDTLTVVHIDGVAEPVTVSSTPFAESEELEQLMDRYEEKLEARKDSVLRVQKAQIKENRKQRYAAYSDDELMNRFNELKEEGAPFAQQMDMMAELVRREVVLEIDLPEILDIDPEDIDMDMEYDPEAES
ncbi:hypothetical protein SAMN05192553_105179 [Cyclobacterium xiamenense]|uniref:Uncharacterized protein n=1 Tax=Cyclobacterium xiamenense TaxID=1297121 RepID=A0A1H7A6J5_9BACT|nr:hypothetical protein [Cyclobacterium xiamenense]SEJ57510.1 hypothetical protein SAMN05192553_105179 [Cyclobacterium xiamenense]